MAGIKMFLVLVVASWCFTLCTSLDEQEVQLGNSNTAFGFNLLSKIQNQEGGNVFLSPFSISVALAMTYLGAGGATASQMADAMQMSAYDNPMERFKKLNTYLFHDQSDMYALRQANRLYGQLDINFKQDYLTDVEKYFNAPLSKVDFSLDTTRLDINAWVAEQTEQKIKDLLNEGDLNGAVLVLINAIYFKAFWELPFDPMSTHDAQFSISQSHNIEVPMMSQTKEFFIGQIPDVQAKILEMKYKGGELSMFIILPDDGFGICDVQDSLTFDKLEDAIKGMQQKMVRVKLPKFEINDKIMLKQYLAGLGMVDMFDALTADFTKITDMSLAVSDVIHQSFVKVDENGTEAAAATAVIILRSALIIPDHEFTVNKPFFFFIREAASKSTLFMGRVVDPTDEETLEAVDYKCGYNPITYAAGVVTSDENGSGVPVLSTFAATFVLIVALFKYY